MFVSNFTDLDHERLRKLYKAAYKRRDQEKERNEVGSFGQPRGVWAIRHPLPFCDSVSFRLMHVQVCVLLTLVTTSLTMSACLIAFHLLLSASYNFGLLWFCPHFSFLVAVF